MSTHNVCFGSKIRKLGIPLQTPVFLCKSGVYRVCISRTCFPDVCHSQAKLIHSTRGNISLSCLSISSVYLSFQCFQFILPFNIFRLSYFSIASGYLTFQRLQFILPFNIFSISHFSIFSIYLTFQCLQFIFFNIFSCHCTKCIELL